VHLVYVSAMLVSKFSLHPAHNVMTECIIRATAGRILTSFHVVGLGYKLANRFYFVLRYQI
jgi:hypothetical protein